MAGRFGSGWVGHAGTGRRGSVVFGAFTARGGGAMTALPPEFAQLDAYWSALRPTGGLPPRSAIEPQAIAHLLDRVVLLERMAPGVARIRLGGSRLADLLGMDLRGMPLTALAAPAARAALADAADAVFTGPAQVTLLLEGERSIGRPALSAQVLLLPLAGRTGLADRAIGVFVLDGTAGRAPRRFVVARAVQRPIEGLTPDAARPGARTAGAPVGGLAEDSALWTPAPPVQAPPRGAAATEKRAPWLRLVARND